MVKNIFGDLIGWLLGGPILPTVLTSMSDIWRLALGHGRESMEYKTLKGVLSEPSETVKYRNGSEYECYYQSGVAIEFKSGKIDSIDFYQSDKKYKDAQSLPSFITSNSTGKNLVEKFGEPDEKIQNGREIWLEFETFNATIGAGDWDSARDAKWTALTIF